MTTLLHVHQAGMDMPYLSCSIIQMVNQDAPCHLGIKVNLACLMVVWFWVGWDCGISVCQQTV